MASLEDAFIIHREPDSILRSCGVFSFFADSVFGVERALAFIAGHPLIEKRERIFNRRQLRI